MIPEEQEIRQHAANLAQAIATENQGLAVAAGIGLLARFLIDLNRLATRNNHTSTFKPGL